MRVGLISALLSAVYVGAFLASGWTPMDLMLPGERASTAGLVEERFGSEILIEDQAGYDGQHFWAMATELPALDDAAEHVRSPRYRFQRILTPALASVGGDGQGAAAALLLCGVLGAGLGAAGLADLALRHRRPAAVGLLFLPPLFVALAFGLSEPLAYGLGMAGLALADRRRLLAAAVVLTFACLARETALLFVGGAGLALLVSRQARIRDLVPFALPVVATVGWALLLASWYPAVAADDRLQLLGALEVGSIGVLLATSIIAAGLLGAWCWRDVPVAWGTALLFGLATLGYGTDLFAYQHLIRISAPACTFALSGLAAWWAARRAPAPGRPPVADGGEEVAPVEPVRSAG
jgi:hypothetical protein